MTTRLMRVGMRVGILLLAAWCAPTLVTPANAQPTATKTWALQGDVNSDGNVDPGDTIRYTVTIGAANNVVFGDGIPDPNTALVAGSVTTTQGTILQGNGGSDTHVGIMIGNISSGTVTITFDVTVANPLPGGVVQVVNQGGVSCDSCGAGTMTDDPSTAAANDPTATPVDNFASLSATKAAALQVDADTSGNVSPGDRLRYTVVVTNTSTDRTAGGVIFADGVPDPNTTLVAGSVTTTVGSVTTGNGGADTTVQVAIGTLAAGSSATIVFDAVIANPLPAGVNQVVQQGVAGCPNCTPQSVPTDDPSTGTANDLTITAVVAAPDLTVTKTAALQVDADGDTQVSPSDTLRYTVIITNSGNQDAAAFFADGIPDPNTALVVGSVTTTQGTILAGNTAGDTSVGVDLGSVAGGGGVATITFDVTINTPLPAFVNQVVDQGGVQCGNCTPQAQGTDDPNTPAADDPTITPVVAAPNITATKIAALLVDVNGNSQIDAGDTLKYTVVITNSGNQDAAGVLLLDFGSSLTDLVVGSVTTTLGAILAGNNPGDVAVAVQIPLLSGGGGSVTIMYARQIKSTLIGKVAIVNQGSITGQNFAPTVTDNPGTPAPNDATVVTAFGPAPAPVLSHVGLLLLIALLAGVAMLGVRRASAGRPIP